MHFRAGDRVLELPEELVKVTESLAPFVGQEEILVAEISPDWEILIPAYQQLMTDPSVRLSVEQCGKLLQLSDFHGIGSIYDLALCEVVAVLRTMRNNNIDARTAKRMVGVWQDFSVDIVRDIVKKLDTWIVDRVETIVQLDSFWQEWGIETSQPAEEWQDWHAGVKIGKYVRCESGVAMIDSLRFWNGKVLFASDFNLHLSDPGNLDIEPENIIYHAPSHINAVAMAPDKTKITVEMVYSDRRRDILYRFQEGTLEELLDKFLK